MEPIRRSINVYNQITRIPIIMKRRDFIKSSLALYALGSYLPTALLGSKNRFSYRNSNIDSDKIVILIKMNGGNDGLNTLIPFQNSSYYQESLGILIQGVCLTSLYLILCPHLSLYPKYLKNESAIDYHYHIPHPV